MLTKLDLTRFVDGEDDARKFVHSFVDPPRWLHLLRRVYRGALAYDSIHHSLGLNPGGFFLKWLKDELRQHGIVSNRQLTEHLEGAAPGLRLRSGSMPFCAEAAAARLAIIAVDVTTQTKVEFPRMARLYWNDPDAVNPAEFARACMSIPFFFEPYLVSSIPQGKDAVDAWRKVFPGPVPGEARFVDGGFLSNFPIALFHRRGVPQAPTFGARLAFDRTKTRDTNTPLDLVTTMFSSARHCLDYDFITRNEDHKRLVSTIDTVGQSWLNFSLSNEAMLELFISGARTAGRFLEEFDWAAYKMIRKELFRAEAPEYPDLAASQAS